MEKLLSLLPKFRALAVVLLPLAGAAVSAEDAGRFRPYLRLHSGDVAPLWGVDDHWSFGLGADFNRRWGGELAVDFHEQDLEDGRYGRLGEVAAWSFLPEARLRFPTWRNRLVPYLVAGAGPTFLQFNDRKPSADGLDIEVEGWTFSWALGAGLEYFLADNVTFGIEGRYLWMHPLESDVAGRKQDVDLSAPLFTFGLRVFFDETEPRALADGGPSAPRRLYFGLRPGITFLTERRLGSGYRLGPEVSAWGDVGHGGGFVLGVNLRRHLGVELALDNVEYSIEEAARGRVGEYSVYSLMPTLRLRLPSPSGRWAPALHLGAGAVYAEVNDIKPAGRDLRLAGDGFRPAVTAGAGLEYFAGRNLSFGLDGRWQHTWDHELNPAEAAPVRGDFSAVYVLLSCRVHLAEW
jgi:opacity protein-like surface antigen